MSEERECPNPFCKSTNVKAMVQTCSVVCRDCLLCSVTRETIGEAVRDWNARPGKYDEARVDALVSNSLQECAVYAIAHDLMEYTTPKNVRDALSDGWGKREDDYSTGFDHAYHHILDLVIEIENQFASLTKEEAMAIKHLYAEQIVFPCRGGAFIVSANNNPDQPILFRILCSDTFAYACADCESFEPADAPMLWKLYQQHGYAGIVAWVSRKRNADPIAPVCDSAYYAARDTLTALLRPAGQGGKGENDESR